MTITGDEAVLRFRNFRAVHGTVGVHASNLAPVSVRQNALITLSAGSKGRDSRGQKGPSFSRSASSTSWGLGIGPG